MIDVNEGITPYEKAETVPELEEETENVLCWYDESKRTSFYHFNRSVRGKDTVPSDYYYELQNILEKKES